MGFGFIRVPFWVLFLFSCISFVIFSVHVFFGNNIVQSDRGLDPRLAHHAQWRPNPETIQKLLSQLNLTTNEDPRVLPLTLHAELLLSNASLCRTQDGGPVDLLFIVHTAPSHLDRRLRMRRTFMSTEHFLPLGFRARKSVPAGLMKVTTVKYHHARAVWGPGSAAVKHPCLSDETKNRGPFMFRWLRATMVRRVFLLGLVREKGLQEALEEEHRQFGDLVQGDFLDSYRNLTLKGVMGYGWMTRYCPHARLVIKTDDDVFFDTFKFIRRYWPLMKDKQRSIFCNANPKHAMGIERKGKWSVDKNVFRTNSGFPYDYCGGFVVVISGDLVPWLFKAAEFAPFFWVDDVYLYGILPAVASDVSFFDLRRVDILVYVAKTALGCYRAKGYNCPVLASLANPSHLADMWNLTTTYYGVRYLRETFSKPRVVV